MQGPVVLGLESGLLDQLLAKGHLRDVVRFSYTAHCHQTVLVHEGSLASLSKGFINIRTSGLLAFVSICLLFLLKCILRS